MFHLARHAATRALAVSLLLGAFTSCSEVIPPPPPRGSIPAERVDAVARQLYDQVAAGARVESQLLGILGPIVHIIPAADQTRLLELVDGTTPVMLEEQISGMADQFAAGERFSLESFFAAASESGATAAQPAGPLTRAYLSAKLEPLVTKTEYAPGEGVAALVIALGRERASRRPAGMTDEVWGDEWLDPLQLALLTYAVHFSAGDTRSGTTLSSTALSTVDVSVARRAPEQHALARDGRPMLQGTMEPAPWCQLACNVMKEWLEEKFGEWIEFPTTLDAAKTAAICASVLMHSYKFTVTATPPLINRRQADNPALPFQSTITATLNFQLAAAARLALIALGCQGISQAGPQGKDVAWLVNSPISRHGDLASQDVVTDAGGKAVAVFEAFDELPPGLRVPPTNEVNATVDATASGLVPGWSRLEAAVGLGMLNPTTEGARVFVRFYDPPQRLTLKVTSRFDMRDDTPGLATTMGIQVSGTIQLRLVHPEGLLYTGSGRLAVDSYYYQPPLPPNCSFTVLSGPGRDSVDVRLEADSAWGDFGLAIFVEQEGAPGEGALTCPPSTTPMRTPIPNPWRGLFLSMHSNEGTFWGWRVNAGQPFATRTFAATQQFISNTITENSVFELYAPAP